MKSLFVSIAREFKLIFRNGLSLYMVFAPALLAIVFILVFGAVNETTLKLAADGTVDAETVQKLERIADVSTYDSTERMQARVLSADAVVGVTMDADSVKLVFEGNEGEEFIASAEQLAGMALTAPDSAMQYKTEAVKAKGGLVYQISMISVLLMSLFIGGATVGLAIVDERENNVIRAVAVSPMRFSEFVISKLIPSMVLGLVGIATAVLIMGKGGELASFLLLALCSAGVLGLMLFAVGAFAANQIAAIGALKLMVPLAMILPISAMFVSDKWQPLYYVLPMYWQYRAIDAILKGANAFWPALLTLLVGIPWFLAAVWVFAKKVKFRFGR